MNWKTRSVAAVATVATLTAGGFAALADGGTADGGKDLSEPPASAEPSPSAAVSAAVDTAELERSLDELLAQVSDLEGALAEDDLARQAAPAAPVAAPSPASPVPSGTPSGGAAGVSAGRDGSVGLDDRYRDDDERDEYDEYEDEHGYSDDEHDEYDEYEYEREDEHGYSDDEHDDEHDDEVEDD